MKKRRLVAASLFLLLPLSSVFAQDEIVEIKKHEVNIRKTASTTGEIAMKAPLGMQFSYLGKEGQWLKVKLSDGTEGFVMGGSLADLVAPCSFKDVALQFAFVNAEITKKGSFQSEVTSTYLINVEGDKITADYDSRYADTKGSMRALDSGNYSGTFNGNTLTLDSNTLTGEKLTTPIIIYYSCNLGGAMINGVFYKDDGGM